MNITAGDIASRELGQQIQHASLMDAMFLLIIFIVVTTTMKKVHRGLPLELPPSEVSHQPGFFD